MEDDIDSFFCFNNINYNDQNYNHVHTKDINIQNTKNLNNDSNIEMNILPSDPLPFQNNVEDIFFLNLPDNFHYVNSKQKAEEKTDRILDKINKFEDTYYNNIISLPNTDIKLHDKQLLAKNLNLIEKTLPGLIICYLFKNNNIPVPESTLYGLILKDFNELRKPNGTKYKVKRN